MQNKWKIIMTTAITTITTPLGTTQTLTGTSAKDDFFTFDSTSSSNGFSASVTTDLSQNTDGTLTYKILDVVKNITTTLILPSLTSPNAIEYINRQGATTAASNGLFQIMAPGDYSNSTISFMNVYGTTGSDTVKLPLSATATANFWGGAGEDVINGAGGTSSLYGGLGKNTLTGNGSIQVMSINAPHEPVGVTA